MFLEKESTRARQAVIHKFLMEFIHTICFANVQPFSGKPLRKQASDGLHEKQLPAFLS